MHPKFIYKIMEIILIRHAEPDYPNNTLTEKGFREADILGKYLKNEKFKAMYVSTLERARYTADGILKYNSGYPVTYLDSLREFDYRVNLPYRENALTWDFRTSYLKNEKLYEYEGWKETDGLNDLVLHDKYESESDEFLKILEKHGYKKEGKIFKVINSNHDKIVFVCHFGRISYMLSKIFNVSPAILTNFTVSAPTGITRLFSEEREKGEAIFRMTEYGSTTHLTLANEPISFMARFCEVFEDETDHVK